MTIETKYAHWHMKPPVGHSYVRGSVEGGVVDTGGEV